MDFNQIQELIRMVSKHKLSEFILREGDFRLVIRNQTVSENAGASVIMSALQPVVTMAPAPSALVSAQAPAEATSAFNKPAAAPAADSSSNLLAIKSPMVGTFYRSASPDKPPFIKVGDIIDTGSPVCVIEAMKLFNEIESDVKGKIVKVLVEDASPVEYDQPLFLVDPS